MISFEKIGKVQKDVICESTYNRFISAGADFLLQCEYYARIMRNYLPSGCYTNFRDALFHFYKMVKSSEEMEINRQMFAIGEHIGRAKTDAMVSLSDELQKILCYMIKRYDLSISVQGMFKEEMGVLCDYQNKLRLNGMMIRDLDVLSLDEDEFFETFERIFQYIMDNVSEQYKGMISKVRRKQKEDEMSDSTAWK